jgi:hypothetical protein
VNFSLSLSPLDHAFDETICALCGGRLSARAARQQRAQEERRVLCRASLARDCLRRCHVISVLVHHGDRHVGQESAAAQSRLSR